MNNLNLLRKNMVDQIKFMLHYSQKEFTAPVLCKILLWITDGKNKARNPVNLKEIHH